MDAFALPLNCVSVAEAGDRPTELELKNTMRSVREAAQRLDARDARRSAIVATARLLFFEHGYGATSMSSIAALVGGSKTTLWTYFQNKEALFEAVLDDLVKRYGKALSIDLPAGAPIKDTLERFAEALMATLFSPDILDLQRMVIGQSARFPKLAEMYWESGPKEGKQRLAAVCNQAMATGELKSGDAMAAAQQFVALCQSGCYQRVLLAIDPLPNADDVASEIKLAVTTFLRCWQADDHGSTKPSTLT